MHPPIALGRLHRDGARATYSGRRVHPVRGEESVTLDPLEMMVRLCQHIPPPGLHLIRLYGAYANRTRGARERRMAGAGERPAFDDREADTATPSQRERRRPWARLIAQVFEVDPLRCVCGATMGVVGFILDPAVIGKILAYRPHLPRDTATAPVYQRCKTWRHRWDLTPGGS